MRRRPAPMPFELLSEIRNVATFAVGPRIRDLHVLRQRYGPGRWRKRKGIALVRLDSGSVRRAEVHSYEAHGVGRVNLKIKRFVD